MRAPLRERLYEVWWRYLGGSEWHDWRATRRHRRKLREKVGVEGCELFGSVRFFVSEQSDQENET